MNTRYKLISILPVLAISFSVGYAEPTNKMTPRVESAADKLFFSPFLKYKQLTKTNKDDLKSCVTDNTAIITVYSVNGNAHSEIDIKLDGNSVGNLTTYFPNNGPTCKTPSGGGVITLIVPSGEHKLEASSPNYYWPNHTFSVDQCECKLLPLS